MSRRTVGVAVGVFTLALVAGRNLSDLPRQVHGRLASRPVLDCPAAVDLGEREDGEIVTARFTVANRGGGELHLTEFRTSCACAGVEREIDGRPVRVEELTLAAGEATRLQVRQSVRGDPGRPVRTPVYFRTTDPDRPEWQLVVSVPAVRGSIQAVPTAVGFGTVPVGVVARQVVEVRDNAVSPRAVSAVAVSGGPLTARLLPLESPAGGLIARVEVTADTAHPGPLDGELTVTVADAARPPLTVPVSGRVAAAYELTPPAVVLPVMTDAGPRYSATALCRFTGGGAGRLAVAEAPAGVTARVVPAGPAAWRVELTADPAATAGGPVRLAADGAALTLPVTVLPAGAQ